MTVTLNLSDEEEERLKQFAASMDMSVDDAIRAMIMIEYARLIKQTCKHWRVVHPNGTLMKKRFLSPKEAVKVAAEQAGKVKGKVFVLEVVSVSENLPTEKSSTVVTQKL